MLSAVLSTFFLGNALAAPGIAPVSARRLQSGTCPVGYTTTCVKTPMVYKLGRLGLRGIASDMDDACPDGWTRMDKDSTTAADCAAALQYLGADPARRSVTTGPLSARFPPYPQLSEWGKDSGEQSWTWAPGGCINRQERVIFNTESSGGSMSTIRPICQQPEGTPPVPTPAYECPECEYAVGQNGVDPDIACPAGYDRMNSDVTTKAECAEALRWLQENEESLQLPLAMLDVKAPQDWDIPQFPGGCVQHVNHRDVYYNTPSTGPLHGNVRPICRKAPSPKYVVGLNGCMGNNDDHFAPLEDVCPPGFERMDLDSTTKEECIAASVWLKENGSNSAHHCWGGCGFLPMKDGVADYHQPAFPGGCLYRVHRQLQFNDVSGPCHSNAWPVCRSI